MGTIIAKSSRRSDCPPTDPKGFGACERCLPPLAIFPKKGQAFSPESVVRSRFRAFLPHFCVDLRGFSAITEPSDRLRHLCDPAERPKNLQAATNLRPETTFRNSAIHLTRIKFSPKKRVHLGSPWNAALTFKKKSGRLPPRKKVALTPNFRQIQVTREEPRKKDERYDQYCRATFQISRSMARLPDHFFQDSSLARRWQEDSNS